jgi:hypothetical protein
MLVQSRIGVGKQQHTPFSPQSGASGRHGFVQALSWGDAAGVAAAKAASTAMMTKDFILIVVACWSLVEAEEMCN